jgi:hypothetical protein
MAASTALPPRSSISAPALAANGWAAVTMPALDSNTGATVTAEAVAVDSSQHAAANNQEL